MASIKTIVESAHLTSVPSSYIFTRNPDDVPVSENQEEDGETIPTVDFSLLSLRSSDQRRKVIGDLGKACQDWGFFVLINHGIPESLTKEIVNYGREFFDLPEEEKAEFEGKTVLDPIRYGTSFNASVDKVLFWRDYLKIMVHPHFHFPTKPAGFRKKKMQRTSFVYLLHHYSSERAEEYCRRTRQVVRELLEGISESLGLEPTYIGKALNIDASLQVFVANLYPPCPQPDLAMGLPPHSDHGILTLLTQNGIGGLQIQHNGKWVDVDHIPNSLLVNTGDHLEILSNGKIKSVLHRAVVNNKSTRISMVMANGPSLDTVVSPAPELVDDDKNPAAYKGMKYREYLQLQQSNKLDGKSGLDRVRLSV